MGSNLPAECLSHVHSICRELSHSPPYPGAFLLFCFTLFFSLWKVQAEHFLFQLAKLPILREGLLETSAASSSILIKVCDKLLIKWLLQPEAIDGPGVHSEICFHNAWGFVPQQYSCHQTYIFLKNESKGKIKEYKGSLPENILRIKWLEMINNGTLL